MTNEEEKLCRQRDGELIEQGRREMWKIMKKSCAHNGDICLYKADMKPCKYKICPLRSKT